MLRSIARTLILLLVAGLAAGGCDETDTPTTPTTPPENITETFSGTVTVNGAVTHTFTTTVAGTIAATLTAVGPDSTAVVGFSLGNWNGTACQIVIANDNATQGTLLTAAASATANLCARVYDVGKLTEPATYSVQVVHN